MSDTDTSKYISLILRHKPSVIGITLDEHGWADVHDLIKGVSEKYPITMEDLERIVREDEKQRYSFNDDKTLIRANQGHSIPVDVELEEAEPPEILFHGTATKFEEAIDREGLIPKSRLYVHLFPDCETAEKVGKRQGQLVVYRIRSGEMHRDGYVFYRSVNGVWLIKAVPVQYMEKISG